MEYKEWIESDEYKNMFYIAGDIQKFKGTDQALNFIVKTAYNAGKRPNQVNRPDAKCYCDKAGEDDWPCKVCMDNAKK